MRSNDYFVYWSSKHHSTGAKNVGSLSIQKGKRAEREVANLLNPILERIVARIDCDPVKLKRNLAQTQSGGFDLEGLPWIAIEIKHHQQVSLGSWWAQTLRQATNDREPVLIWKKHGGKWLVRMYARLTLEPGRRLKVVADVSLEAFLVWFEKRAEVELKKKSEGDSFPVADGLFD